MKTSKENLGLWQLLAGVVGMTICGCLSGLCSGILSQIFYCAGCAVFLACLVWALLACEKHEQQ